MEATANTRGRTTRASAASDSHRKQGDAGATTSALTKPGAAGFQANASPFSPYKNSPAPKPSPRNAPKPSESSHQTSTPPPSSSTPAAPATASPAAATPQSAPAPSVASPGPANKHALGPNSSPRSQPTSGAAPQLAAPNAPAPMRAPAPQNTPQAQAKPSAPTAAAKPPAASPPKPASPVPSAVKQEEDPSSDDRSATQGSSQGKPRAGHLPNKQERPPGYVHGNEGKNRSPYKCNKCGQPKKGHVCTSVLVPPFLQTGTSPMMKPNSPVGPVPMPQPKGPNAAMPHGAVRAGGAAPHEPAFYANWFDMAVSSLDILRTSLVNNQDKLATWNELRACNAFVTEAQTRIRQFRESLRQSEAQLKQRGIPVRVRGVDPSEAEAVEGLLRGLSEPRDAGAVPNVPKRMRSSDRGDETEPEEMARKAPKAYAPAETASGSSSGSGKIIAAAAPVSTSAPPSAPTSQSQSHEGTPRKRTLLATSDEEVPAGPVPVAKAARAASEPIAKAAKPSAPEPAPQKEPSSSSEDSDEQRQESPTPNTLVGAASQTLVSQPVQLSQPTASQTEQEIARMLQTPPGSQELAVMAPPAPKLVSPTKRSLLASDELLRPAPTLFLQGSSQPLSQVSDLDLEHAPDL